MKVGACALDLEATESLKGPLVVRDQNGWPACSHSRSIRASKLQRGKTSKIKLILHLEFPGPAAHPRTVLQSGLSIT